MVAKTFPRESKFAGKSVIVEVPGLGKIGIESCPLRRRQTLFLYFISLLFVMPMVLLCWAFTIYSIAAMPFKGLGAVVAGYLSYVYIIDNSSIDGSRTAWMRSKLFWRHACDFFPTLLVKTAELDPSKNYILGYHPHGIISCGAMVSFATEGCQTLSLTGSACSTRNLVADDDEPTSLRGFSALYPGIERRLITLPQNFLTPFLREYLLWMGCVDSSRNTFRQNLKGEGGRAVVVVVGGAAESMLVKPGEIELVLNKRKGFVREAIITGASLVPVIAFGENDLYEVFDTGDHWVSRFQATVKKLTGVAVPIFKGRSILFRDFGLMPQRRPIVVVVGAPIDPPKLGEAQRKNFRPKFDRATSMPLDDDAKLVSELHEKYVESLQKLYTTHKDQPWNVPGLLRSGSLRIK